ncbi:MAG: sigma-70 family RNA polymerase sigma factor [SAR202 cluster bacterium]|nr:sigma-70 family RNA polymerase sigma factor [SAR202 cluster bacterium]
MKQEAMDNGLAGDAAFVSLIETYEARVLRYVTRLVPDVEDARDLTHEVFLRAYRRKVTLRSHGSVASWLFAIASNIVRDYHRRRRRVLSFVPFSAWREAGEAAADGAPADDGADTVARVMARMPGEMVQCLVLHEVEGFTSIEIAAVLGIRPEAVRQRIVRARKRFRELYVEMGGGPT